MCDYSLMEFPNRLAVEGEVLMVHRFPTGSLGLASPHDCARVESKPIGTRNFWSTVKQFFHPPVLHSVPAVCIPPGARLVLHDVPTITQQRFAVGVEEHVTFVQITAAAHGYRDAVRFRTGYTLRLQDLREGQRVEVVDLGYDSPEEPDAFGASETMPVRVVR